MQWTDPGIVLSARRHGESAAIVELLTEAHGRHAGLVRGGAGKRLAAVLQPGNRVSATWRGRLPEHLGQLSLEPAGATAAGLLDAAGPLAGLASAVALLRVALPEREPHPRLFAAFGDLAAALAADADWPMAYVRFELLLLAELGFGLDLTRCAATGSTEDLTHVSPVSGRAVSAAAARAYRDRLLPLPAFLLGSQAASADAAAIADGLALTGHFLNRHALAPQARAEPAARRRFAARFSR
ncbi:MAG: DNA repair protein RecO [Alphaproteobacteria bacterium]|nr:DNA repair protein RecO [Alphaproteobacteria bacterium]